MVRVVWSFSALDKLEEVRQWIAPHSRAHDRDVVRRMRARIDQLKLFPLSGRILPEYPLGRRRELIAGSYRIIYRYDEDALTVVILAVPHGSRTLAQPDDQQ